MFEHPIYSYVQNFLTHSKKEHLHQKSSPKQSIILSFRIVSECKTIKMSVSNRTLHWVHLKRFPKAEIVSYFCSKKFHQIFFVYFAKIIVVCHELTFKS